jgi:hypothetical protein
MNEVKEKKLNRSLEALDEQVTDLAARCRLKDWSYYIESIELPNDVLPALMTGRPELLQHLQPRALTEEETAKLYKALGALIETNMALREHAEQLAQLTANWAQQFRGLQGVGNKIQNFANFRRSYDEETELA